MVEMAYQARLVGMVKMERLERRGSLASEAHLDPLDLPVGMG